MANSRDSMQDVLNSGGFVFSKPCSFEEAYPDIESIKIEYTESGVGAYSHIFNERSEGKYKRCLSDKNYIAEYIRCSNRLCVHGGFCVGEKIRDLVREKETAFEGTIFCCGNEGSPKGRRIYRRCLNNIEVKITLSYKE